MDDLAALVAASREGPAGGFTIAPRDPAAGLLAERLRAAGHRPDHHLTLVRRNNRAAAAALARLLPWDTEFFGHPCGIIDTLLAAGENERRFDAAAEAVAGTLSWAREQGVRFLAIRLNGPDPIVCQALEHHGFYVTNALVAMSRPQGPVEPVAAPPGFAILPQAPDIGAAARAFTRLFYDGRFHNDRRIPVAVADRLWATALANQLGGVGEQLALAMKGREPAGLAVINTVKASGPLTGTLFILGVIPDCRRLGLARALMADILDRVNRRYAAIVLETSTFNQPAIRLYRSLGFATESTKLSLHWWAEDA